MINLLAADARAVPLRDSCVDLVFTSPPYFGMRDYGSDAEIGAEATPDDYTRAISASLAEIARVLKPQGSAFLVIGDKYARTGGVDRKARGTGADPGGRVHERRPQKGVKGIWDKSLIGLPFRVAIAAIDDGWIWRQEIVWHKPNPLPESVSDRYQRSHETILHLTLSGKYYGSARESGSPLGHDVWRVPVEGYRDPLGRKHPAVFPVELARRAVEAYSPPGGVVLDPFIGSGTTLVAARAAGRHGIGADLSRAYLALAATRLA